MIFEVLSDAAERGELLLVDGGLCHWHLRRDGQLTIREILVVPEKRNQGVGVRILQALKGVDGAISVFAKCPVELPSNGWYARMGFQLEGTETTRSERKLNLWRLVL